ncbi:MAG: transglycosylase SLT domain-containing protein [Candidatus Kapaibacterium sp.]
MSIESFDTSQNRILAQKAKIARKINEFDNVKISQKSKMTDTEKSKIEQASRGFESIFVNMMLTEMKKAQLEEKDDEGFGGNTMQEMAQLNLADNISKQGRGMGIAQMMYKQMTGDNIPNRNSYTVPQQQLRPINISDSAAARISQYDEIIGKASKEYGIPENLIKSVIAAESAGNHKAVSSAGAKGLMQLMDGTAEDLGVNNSFNPEENILGGTNYLNKMLNKFDGSLELALAAYNAGPGNVEKHNGIPPFDETRKYISRVLSYNMALGEK